MPRSDSNEQALDGGRGKSSKSRLFVISLSRPYGVSARWFDAVIRYGASAGRLVQERSFQSGTSFFPICIALRLSSPKANGLGSGHDFSVIGLPPSQRLQSV